MPFYSFWTGCKVLLCDFHREQAWERWVTKKENGVCNYKDEVLCRLRRVAGAKTHDRYHTAVEQLKSSDIRKNNPKLIQWFGNKWLKANKEILSITMKEKNKQIIPIMCSSRKYPYFSHRFFCLAPPPRKFYFSFILCF